MAGWHAPPVEGLTLEQQTRYDVDAGDTTPGESGGGEVGVSEQDRREPTLEQLGLAAGEPVRWRRPAGGRWNQGTVIQREADGSVAVRDANGAWRSLAVERLEAQIVTPRGAKRWKPLTERAAEHGKHEAEEAERAAEEPKRAAAEQVKQVKLKLW